MSDGTYVFAVTQPAPVSWSFILRALFTALLPNCSLRLNNLRIPSYVLIKQLILNLLISAPLSSLQLRWIEIIPFAVVTGAVAADTCGGMSGRTRLPTSNRRRFS
jgi:hypothetical protein